ncbi:MAG TPA: TraB/GumN family protein [Chromatiales bacterium]|nr:TraB/GumN family protein [Thiotrichales bacterium]HIP69551.1 TraB/GumN family protein [Chromatiales bacterium]
MKHLIFFIILLSPCYLFPDSTKTICEGKTFSKGLLWEVKRENSEPDYLFGTIHLDDPQITTLPDIVEKTLLASQRYVMEIEMHPLAMATYTERSRLSGEKSLDQFLSQQEYLRLKKLVSEHYGLDENVLRQLKPWAVFTLLSRPLPKGGKILDLVLADLARKGQLDTSGLETMHELLDDLDSLSVSDQLEILRDTVKNFSILEQQLAALKEKYLQQDLTGMQNVSMSGHSDELLFERLMDRLLYRRNARMLDRIEPLLQKEKVFIAVGVLHLPGERGLLCGLASRGYQLRRLY